MSEIKEDSTHVEHTEKKTIVRYEQDGHKEETADGLELVESTVELRDFSDKETKRILWKLDIRLLPILALFYLLAYLDRGNMGNAAIAGMTDDLGLVGSQYNIALTMFFIPYALLEVPSNVVLRLIRPSWWIAIMMFSWGVVMYIYVVNATWWSADPVCRTLMGIVQGFSGLVAARWFLGVCESGFFPAASFLLTLFYKRYEVLTRLAIFYSAASLSGAFGGLFAFALEKMDGLGGLEGWRWIFIIEGFLPIIACVIAIFFVPDSPETCRFLTKEERNWLIYRLQIETGSHRGRVTNNDKMAAHHVWAAMREWKTWANMVVFWGSACSNYAFVYTAPIVVYSLGYSTAVAQLMLIPIYSCACIFVIIWARLSDHYGVRSTFIMIGQSANAIAQIGLLSIPHPQFPGLTYFFLFVALSGVYCTQQLLVSWTANNSAPSSKRAIAMALLLAGGNLSGVVGSNIFIAAQSPFYWAGYGTCLGTSCAGICATIILRIAYKRINAERDKVSEEEIRAKYTEAQLLDLGDKSPYFRYTL